jgi:hypothetical protein
MSDCLDLEQLVNIKDLVSNHAVASWLELPLELS